MSTDNTVEIEKVVNVDEPVEEETEEKKEVEEIEEVDKEEKDEKDETAEEEEIPKERPRGDQDAAWKRLQRRKDDYKQRAERAEAMIQQQMYQQLQPQQQPVQESDEPARDQYADDAGYLKAWMEWSKLGITKQVRQEFYQQQQETQQTQAKEAWDKKLAVTREKYPDYDEVLEEALDIKIPENLYPALTTALQESDLGGDIWYYLSSNPDEARRVMQMSPTRVALEIGRLESILESELKQTKKVLVSKAPSPVASPKASSGKSSRDPNKMTPEEYYAWRMEDKRKK
jgi:hypothetical protein